MLGSERPLGNTAGLDMRRISELNVGTSLAASPHDTSARQSLETLNELHESGKVCTYIDILNLFFVSILNSSFWIYLSAQAYMFRKLL